MTSDWSWTFASEYGRDRILRDRLEELESQSSSASVRASRLSAQLARTQGSLEARLDALSRAFDAYVELGDVREQLRGFSGTAEVRRQALRAVEALGQGRPSEALPADDTYWLVPAVAAVAARVAGTPDLDAEGRAIELDRAAELFIVVTLGMVSHGPTVADRVTPLLVTDAGLTVEQQALWQAVLEGLYGPTVLSEVRASFAPALRADRDGSELWRLWLLEVAPGGDRVAELTWLLAQLTGSASAGPTADPRPDGLEAPPTVSATDRLKAVAARLIAEGRSDERDLLTRAQELRGVIESPDSRPADGEERERAEQLSVPHAVQQAIAAAPPGSAVQRELFSWLTGVLRSAIDRIAAGAIPAPATVRAHTPGRVVEVTGSGADPAAVQRAKSAAADVPSSAGKLIALTVGTGVLLVAAIVLLATGSVPTGSMAGVGALTAGIGAAVAWRDARDNQRRRASDVADVDRAIADAEARARAADQEGDELAGRLRTVHRELTAALDALEPAPAGTRD